MPERGFLIFFFFFAFFFWNFHPRAKCERNSGQKIFFLSFLAYLLPFWLKIMPGRDFLIVWFFFAFFLKFSCPSWVRTEFRSKIFSLFLGLSHPVLAKYNAGKRFFNFLNFFTIFFFAFPAYLLSFWLKVIPQTDFLIFWYFLLFFL